MTASKSVSNLLERTETTEWYVTHTGSSDIICGILSFHVWLALGWHDIRQRYRRSVLGPFWFTLSTLIMVVVLGILYSELLQQDVGSYLPYLAVGLVIWQYISSCAMEGSSVFIDSGYLIKQIRMPLTIHVCRLVWRNFVILLHSLPIIIVLMIFFGHLPGVEFFLLFPALLILLLQGVWIGIVFGIMCVRYRDVLPIIANIVQVAFFFTPVMWMVEHLKSRAWVAQWNPLYHLMEIVRAPIIGSGIHWQSWAVSIGMLVVGSLLAQHMMKMTRNRVPYWL